MKNLYARIFELDKNLEFDVFLAARVFSHNIPTQVDVQVQRPVEQLLQRSFMEYEKRI
jgi:hypothetical protein